MRQIDLFEMDWALGLQRTHWSFSPRLFGVIINVVPWYHQRWNQQKPLLLSGIEYALFPVKASSLGSLYSLAGKRLFLPF